jgi:hypothetical protein
MSEVYNRKRRFRVVTLRRTAGTFASLVTTPEAPIPGHIYAVMVPSFLAGVAVRLATNLAFTCVNTCCFAYALSEAMFLVAAGSRAPCSQAMP